MMSFERCCISTRSAREAGYLYSAINLALRTDIGHLDYYVMYELDSFDVRMMK
jgi:hypothetical protein